MTAKNYCTLLSIRSSTTRVTTTFIGSVNYSLESPGLPRGARCVEDNDGGVGVGLPIGQIDILVGVLEENAAIRP